MLVVCSTNDFLEAVLKTIIKDIFVLLLLTASANAFALEKLDKLRLTGPKAPVTLPLAYIIEAGLLDGHVEKIELVIWKNPDQLRSLILGGQAHFAAAPSHVAATLHNKGVPLKLLNISVWGDYWIISNDPSVESFEDLKNQRVAVPYRNGTPSTVFRLLAEKLNIDPENDLTIKHMPNFIAALQEVSSGRVNHAFLSEPHASLSVLKTKHKKNKLYKSINVAQQWGEAHNSSPRISRAGMVALPSITARTDIVNAFQSAYKQSVNWCNDHPEEAGRLANKYIPGFKEKAVSMALKSGSLDFKSALDSRDDIEHFYTVLLSNNPKKIGGKLPVDSFYFIGK